ncbi:hypothetical protein DMC47_04385 [Nostoc sp. 3335mG]|nr:hypothetical protein DMC47_04385 [Nostoc sp. 3335mG]
MTAIDTDNNAAATPTVSDAGLATVVYVLYLIGFFTGVTALIGVILAYVGRGDATALARSHYDYQIRTFWRGVIFLGGALALTLVASFIGIASMGVGVMYGGAPVGLGSLLISGLVSLLPLALVAYWAIWTAYRTIKGLVWINKQRSI